MASGMSAIWESDRNAQSQVLLNQAPHFKRTQEAPPVSGLPITLMFTGTVVERNTVCTRLRRSHATDPRTEVKENFQ